MSIFVRLIPKRVQKLDCIPWYVIILILKMILVIQIKLQFSTSQGRKIILIFESEKYHLVLFNEKSGLTACRCLEST